MELERYLGTDGVPENAPCEHIDAGELPPPEPLTKTLEKLAELDDETVLVQSNDRAPQHLYPKLNERGYEYITREEQDSTVTVIWKPR
jgi:TusA-related sulfurtransferase